MNNIFDILNDLAFSEVCNIEIVCDNPEKLMKETRSFFHGQAVRVGMKWEYLSEENERSQVWFTRYIGSVSARGKKRDYLYLCTPVDAELLAELVAGTGKFVFIGISSAANNKPSFLWR